MCFGLYSTRRNLKNEVNFSRRFAVFAPCLRHRQGIDKASTRRNLHRIATESRPIATESRPNRDRIGRPPPPFFVGRAALDPRSLNFFALHCDFLQKVCNKEVFFFALHCAFLQKVCKKGGCFFCPPLRFYTHLQYDIILFGLALGGMSYFFHTFRASDATVASHLAHGRIPSGGTALPICLLTAVLPPHHLQGGDGGKDCSAARSSFVRARPPSA